MTVVLSFFAGLPAGLWANSRVRVETCRHVLEGGADVFVAEPARNMLGRSGAALCGLVGFSPYLESVT